MKTKKSLTKLILNKNTVANLNLRKMRMIKAGEPPSESGYIACDAPYSLDDDGCSRICLETVYATCDNGCVSTVISCTCMC